MIKILQTQFRKPWFDSHILSPFTKACLPISERFMIKVDVTIDMPDSKRTTSYNGNGPVQINIIASNFQLLNFPS